MNNSIKKTATISAVIGFVSFIVYTLCFIAIFIVNEPYVWQGLEHFIEYENTSTAVFKYVGMACMLIYSIAFFIAVSGIAFQASDEKRIFAKLAKSTALAFMLLISVAYFVQMTATRLQLLAGNSDGLLQITQSYNISAINAINMLGWTVFYPLACLFMMHCLNKKVAKAFCLATAISMLIGLIGYMTNSFIVLLITMNLLLGGCSFGLIICLLSHFKKSGESNLQGTA